MLRFGTILTEFSVIMLGFSSYQLIFLDYSKLNSSFSEQFVPISLAIAATIISLFGLSVFLREQAKLGGAEEFLIAPTDRERAWLKALMLPLSIVATLVCIWIAYSIAGFREAYCYVIGFGLAYLSMIEEIDRLKRHQPNIET